MKRCDGSRSSRPFGKIKISDSSCVGCDFFVEELSELHLACLAWLIGNARFVLNWIEVNPSFEVETFAQNLKRDSSLKFESKYSGNTSRALREL